ncbi:MAG TPA: response regulator [Xanthomonadaceae bacterium]|nr:response regulator [Xanthomonadaceae bacterium]
MNRFALLKRIFRGASVEVDRRKTERMHAREGLRVLIIDDSATIVAVLSKLMRQNGYEPVGAGDAEQGLEIAMRDVPDLIFLDIVLPGMNGFAALRALRREPITRDIPIIMISGNAQATEQFYAQRIGADDFMKKPFGRAEVFSRIEQLVQSGRLRGRNGGDAPVANPAPGETAASSGTPGKTDAD